MSIFVKTKVDVTCKWPSLHAHREMQVEKVVQHQFRLGLFKIKIFKQSLCLSIKLKYKYLRFIVWMKNGFTTSTASYTSASPLDSDRY